MARAGEKKNDEAPSVYLSAAGDTKVKARFE